MKSLLLNSYILILLFNLSPFQMEPVYLLVFVLQLLIQTDDFLFKIRKLSFVRVLHVNVLDLKLDQLLILWLKGLNWFFVVVYLHSKGVYDLLLLKDFLQMKLVFVKDSLMVFHLLVVESVVERIEHTDELDVSFSEDFGFLLLLLSFLFLLSWFLVLNNLLVKRLDSEFEFGEVLLKDLSLEFILILLSSQFID
jgi:hypothetical protein